nr:hypothetical protein [Tanacetum cinerariifolium]
MNEQVYGVTLNEDIGVEQFSYLVGVLGRKNSSEKKYNPDHMDILLNNDGNVTEEKLVLLRDNVKPMNTHGDMSCNARANYNGEPSSLTSSTSGMEAMFEGGPWLISNVSLILRKWTHMTNVSKENLKSVQVWVKPCNVPITGFTEEGLSAISIKGFWIRVKEMNRINKKAKVRDEEPRISGIRGLFLRMDIDLIFVYNLFRVKLPRVVPPIEAAL